MPADFSLITDYILNAEGKEQQLATVILSHWASGKEWLEKNGFKTIIGFLNNFRI